ncbi:hypothetical protein FRC00_013164 [Tulasnella sp. 408]|nr:hypothetical protein FRC00_013164 [Tulasnella sp. 408]
MSSDAPSKACCTIPPVVTDTDSYKPKGSYISFEHADKEKYAKDPITRAYVTGPTDTGKTIIVIFDIFGQGADLIAETVKAKVVMPDFFRDEPMDLKYYPPTTDEAKQKISEFFRVKGNFDDRLAELVDAAQAERNKGVAKVAAVGYCFGAKVTTLGNIKGAFDATAAIHPAFLAGSDGENIQAPIAVFPSKDENVEEYNKFVEAANKKPFASKNVFKRYETSMAGLLREQISRIPKT